MEAIKKTVLTEGIPSSHHGKSWKLLRRLAENYSLHTQLSAVERANGRNSQGYQTGYFD